MKNEFTVTKQEMLSWVKRYNFTGAANKILFALYLLLGLVGVSLLLTVISNDGDKFGGAIGIASVIISVYKLFFERRVFMLRRYNLYAKTYGVDEWQRIIEFTDDEIVINDQNMRKIIDKGNVVFIVLNNNIAMRFYKDTFTEGTWEDCKTMLESKMK